MTEVASLEARIESAWLKLATGRHPLTVYLDGAMIRLAGPQETALGREVGTYDRNVSLADFRADVFHEYARCRA